MNEALRKSATIVTINKDTASCNLIKTISLREQKSVHPVQKIMDTHLNNFGCPDRILLIAAPENVSYISYEYGSDSRHVDNYLFVTVVKVVSKSPAILRVPISGTVTVTRPMSVKVRLSNGQTIEALTTEEKPDGSIVVRFSDNMIKHFKENCYAPDMDDNQFSQCYRHGTDIDNTLPEFVAEKWDKWNKDKVELLEKYNRQQELDRQREEAAQQAAKKEKEESEARLKKMQSMFE